MARNGTPAFQCDRFAIGHLMLLGMLELYRVRIALERAL